MNSSNFLVKYKAYLVSGGLAAVMIAHAFGLLPDAAYQVLLNLLGAGGGLAVAHKVTLGREARP
jgi:hypothetical protein